MQILNSPCKIKLVILAHHIAKLARAILNANHAFPAIKLARLLEFALHPVIFLNFGIQVLIFF